MQLWEEKAYERLEGKEEGIKIGKEIGLAVGEQEKLISLIVKKLIKNKPVNIIAEEVEESIEKVKVICDVAQKYAPAYDVETIRREVYGEPRIDKTSNDEGYEQ